jgi:subtilisin family serine protease
VIGPIVVVLALTASPPEAAPSVATGLRALDGHEQALVGIEHAHAGAGGWALLSHGGVRLSPDLELWRVRSSAASRLVPRLAAAGMVRSVGPDLRFRSLDLAYQLEPLFPTQWWYRLVGADQAQAPGPGKPLTVLDTGIDLAHPEFRGRPDTTVLNTITFNDDDRGSHGTAVGSLMAAPVNGVGLVGVYPQARLQVWDGYDLSFGAVIAGLAAASRLGPGVINLSLGYPAGSFAGNLLQPVVDAINATVRRGSLVVAAAGNGREDGSPELVPAGLPHVLTVGATDPASEVAYFSNAGLTVDLVAPGDRVPIAAPLAVDPTGYRIGSGTSFSSPIVAGAAAWIWTARPRLDASQVFEVMRRSARNLGPPGFDADTGFGMLDVPAALAYPAPAPDPLEPNEDVVLVKRNKVFANAMPALPRTLTARLTAGEDPNDVYRVRVPAKRSVVVTVRGDADVDLELWRPWTVSVHQRDGNLAAVSARRGRRSESARFRNRAPSAVHAFVNVKLRAEVPRAGYRVSVAVRP